MNTDRIMKKHIKNAGTSISSALIPVSKQIYNAKGYQKRKKLVSGDVFQNIMS